MKARLLGTGAADGWPQPFCRCPSCSYARSQGIVRGRSGTLIDDAVLIDPSPDVTTSSARAGITLDDVTTILVGHAHPDHLDPSLLLARSWIPSTATRPLTVIGPRSALDTVRPWLDPAALESGAIVLEEAVIGSARTLASGHVVRAFAAEHGLGASGWPTAVEPVEAVLWHITAPDGSRLLSCTDTGPLPGATIEAIAAAGSLDVLLVEETFGDVTDHGTAHLDLTTLPTLLASMMNAGAVSQTTQVIAVHLSHHNPPEPELVRRLAAWGVRAGRDLDVITTPATSDSLTAPRQPHRTLVTGGARSGKSREAERLLAAHPNVTYVATAAPREDGDSEWNDRVRAHQQRRPATWATVETHNLTATIAAADDTDALLIDCLTLWLAGVIDDADGWNHPDLATAAAQTAADDLVAALRAARCRVVLVTNEVGSGIVPEGAGTRMYRDLLGSLNARVADACDDVLLVVAGRPLRIGAPA